MLTFNLISNKHNYCTAVADGKVIDRCPSYKQMTGNQYNYF